MKPKGLWATFVVMCIMNLAGFAFVDSQAASFNVQLVIFAVVIAISYLVLWFYLQGRNWARILVLLTSVVALLNLLTLPSIPSLLPRTIVIVEAIFGTFLLWWLNTVEVREYFKGRRV